MDDGHTQLLQVEGEDSTSADTDRSRRSEAAEPLALGARQIATLEAEKLRGGRLLVPVDRIRKWKWLAPWAVFFYVLLRGGWRDGWRGLYYANERLIAEATLALELIEGDMRRRTHGSGSEPSPDDVTGPIS